VGTTDSEIMRVDWRRLVEEANRFLKEKENHRERDSPADKLQLRQLGMKPMFLRFDHGICLQNRSAMLRYSHLLNLAGANVCPLALQRPGAPASSLRFLERQGGSFCRPR
jgi:hypothetical protein